MCEHSTEVWKAVAGYEGHYEVSDLGRIRSVSRVSKSYRIMKQDTNWKGYKRICLCKENIKKNHSVHSLVLEAFVGPKPFGMQARHFPDQSKSNNSLGNLSWATQEENSADKIINGTSLRGKKRPCVAGINHPRAILDDEKVRRILRMHRSGIGCQKVADELGVSVGTVRSAVCRKTWRHVVEAICPLPS